MKTTSKTIPAGAKGVLFVVSTSHMDWDWIATFDQYYGSEVRDILDTAVSLMTPPPAPPNGESTRNLPYQYNLAEIAWLQRYLQDNPDLAPTLATFKGRLFFLGGGITSPDNLVCNGEAFIRNYLVGRRYIRGAGLGDLLTDVCWIPDDFGHDPQLPVVLDAMGMKGVSFWRVPGNEPIPPSSYQPTDLSIQPLSTQLAESGVTFFWQAADGSTILAQQMSGGYGVIWDQASSGNASQDAQTLNGFVTAAGVVQPGNLYMAPCGGDFSMPSSTLVDAVQAYNQSYYPENGIFAILGTFQDFLQAMNRFAANNPGAVKTLTDFDASNFWTGHFASRVELKINQQRSVDMLMAAETLSTLLRGQANFSGSVLDGLDRSIDAAWDNLLPSTHHDYVTGTSPDQTYWLEQLPLSELTLRQSHAALEQAMARLGEAVSATPQSGEVPYVVWNPSGFTRAVGGVVRIPAHPDLAKAASYRLAGQSVSSPVQTLKNGDKVISCPNLGSTAYVCAYLSSTPAASPPQPLPEDASGDSVTMDNGIVQVTLTKANGWAIGSIKDVTHGSRELLPAGAGNQIQVYYESPVSPSSGIYVGNLYQMGNELYPTSTSGDGFFADDTSSFEGQSGELVENGPYLWHFRGQIRNAANNLTLTVEYFLEAGEPLVRVRVTGQAGTKPTSVVSTWTVTDLSGNPPSGMSYGTPNHWNGPAVTPYWNGPTFRSTHDYVTLLRKGNESGPPLAAVYHEGMRAWAFDGRQLLGILFRNPPGVNRGAAGTDLATHIQSYAFRIPGVGGAASCQPLQESLAFQVRQPAARVAATSSVLAALPETGMLAALQEDGAIIRVARSQPGSGGTPTDTDPSGAPPPFSFVLRIYQPTNSTSGTWHVSVPFLAAGGRPQPAVSLVTALEEPTSGGQAPAYADGVITMASMPTLATLRIQSVGTYLPPTDGR